MPERKAFWREMLDYEWGNPSTMMFSGEEGGGEGPEPNSESDPAQQIMDHYGSTHQTNFDINIDQNNNINHHLLPNHQQSPAALTTFSQHHFNHHHPQAHLTSPTLYDPRADLTGSHYAPQPGPHHQYPLLSLDPTFPSVGGGGGGANGFLLVPKNEDVTLRAGAGPMDFASRIGLNLGGRTYFSSTEDDFLSRLYRRSRLGQDPASSNSPRCQAEGCNVDMTHAKHYHRRHKVCEFHSKASTVIAAGLTQRFCQQCSRFHVLTEFDNGKRSCRKRLADHNRRRRKTQLASPETPPKLQLDHNAASPSDHTLFPRSPADSGARSSSSVTVATSPPRMTLDYFQQKTTYPSAATASSASLSSLFSSGS